MLGRLEMDVDECIHAYTTLSQTIFSKKESRFGLGFKGNLKAKFSSQRLREGIETVLKERGVPLEEAFNDGQTGKSRECRVFVCSCDRANKDIVRLKSYDIPGKAGPLNAPSIIQVALATSAAPQFFDRVNIDDVIYLDGALGANNPVKQVASEAADIWFEEEGDPGLQTNIKCFLSIGTGHPGVNPVKDEKAFKFLSTTLVQMATDTQQTASEFADFWRGPLDNGRYFRFDVQHGLQEVGLEEYKKKGDIQSMTRSYLAERENQQSVRDCVKQLKDKQSVSAIDFS
ncbi:hypothetical protein N0V90_009615 [Kalmusia sp. IMI 367209]|nr:hypothetical protein N0V90_009615 [Kalmusia sp. IMI 367209]